MLKPKAVFFDLDDTLLDDDTSMREALKKTCCLLAADHPAIDVERLQTTYLEASTVYWTAHPHGLGDDNLHRPTALQIRARVWSIALNRCETTLGKLAFDAAEIYTRFRQETHRMFPDVLPVLDALRTPATLCLITNGPGDGQREKLVATGLDAVFDAVLISGELGFGKPDARIFQRALDFAGVPASDAVHIGDSPASDVAGAKGAGIGAIWLNRPGGAYPDGVPVPDAELRTLADLNTAIGLQL